MMDPKFAGEPIPDIEKMPENPNRAVHHRRAHSETFFRLPDNILVDDFDLSTLDLPSLNIDSSDGPDKAKRSRPLGPTSSSSSSHFRSLSVDSDFFDGLGLADGGNPEMGQRKYHHRHSNSMDGSTVTSFDSEIPMMMMDTEKKLVGPDNLAQLSLIDPKRAKRVLANRQSAARSKERKVRYTSELERKVQTLQSEATTLSAQVTVLQRDATGMTIENKELKMRLEALEQQAHLRDALTERLREEVQRLKIEAGQAHHVNRNSFNRALPPHFPSNQQSYHHFGNQQGQQAPQQQIHTPQSISNYNQARSGLPQPSFADLNHRI